MSICGPEVPLGGGEGNRGVGQMSWTLGADQGGHWGRGRNSDFLGKAR